MKKVTGTCYSYSESNPMKELQHKGVILWQEKMFLEVQQCLDNQEPIQMDYLLSKTFVQEVSENFSKADLVKLLESSPKIRVPLTYIKILSELMIRFSEKESSIRHFLARQSTNDLGSCLQAVLSWEKYETACYIRDEIGKRIIE